MTYLFENQNPAVQANGLNTNKAVALGSTVAATGVLTATAGVTSPTTFIAASTVATSTLGGSTTPALLFSTTSGLGIYFGTGVPTITAAQGSLYSCVTGSSTSTRLFVNYGGTAGWNSVTTSA